MQKPIITLGINPGTKYLGYAILHETELREWGVKSFSGKWSNAKRRKIQKVVSEMISRYRVTDIVIKQLHPSRSSRHLNDLAACLRRDSEGCGLNVYQFSISELKAFFSSYCENPVQNKRSLSQAIATKYPSLFNELEKEGRQKNRYHTRMFEAVGLGSLCFSRTDFGR
jgi:hypothetical protein